MRSGNFYKRPLRRTKDVMTDEEMMQAEGDEVQMRRLLALMHRLRAPGGCSWDAEQSHESLITNLVEEAYETIDAIQRKKDADMVEELGDLLLQVVFHSEIAKEGGRFEFSDVARAISEKMIRRHPHVFREPGAKSSEELLRQWDEIKRQEKGEKDVSYLHGVGVGLPALLRAAKLQKKAAKVGFDWPDEEGVLAKIREEISEVEEALKGDADEAIKEEIGDLLFSVVNLARFRELDPEILLAATNRKFAARFGKMEDSLAADGKQLSGASLKEMELAWTRAKLETSAGG